MLPSKSSEILSPLSTALPSTVISLAFFSCSLFNALAISSSLTTSSAFFTSIPLYSPRVTAGLTATNASYTKSSPFLAFLISICGLETISSSLSLTALGYVASSIKSIASGIRLSEPYIFSKTSCVTCPFLNPGTLNLFLFLLKESAIALSNSLASTVTVSFAMFFSNFCTSTLIKVSPCFINA